VGNVPGKIGAFVSRQHSSCTSTLSVANTTDTVIYPSEDNLADPIAALSDKGDVKPEIARRPSVLYLVGSLAGGNYVAMLLGMVGGVIMGRLVAPATLGLFNGIGLALGYAPFLQLGILNGLNRELPYYVGKGDRQRVEELAATAQAWALAVGGAVCLALVSVAAWQFAHGEWWLAAGWLTNAILAVFLFYNTYYLQSTYRTAHDFARLAWVAAVQSLIGLVLLGLVAWLNFYGLCLRALLIGVIGTGLLFHWRPVRVGPKWNARHLKHLLVIGAPIFGVGQLYAWWSVIISTLVLKFAGVEGMGLYAMVSMASSAIELIPSAVSQVVYPRMAEQFGRSNSLDELLRIAWKPMMFTAAGLVPVIALAWWLVGPVVNFVMPAYAAAVPAMQWGLLLAFVTSFAPVCNVFNIVRRQDLYVVAILLGMAASGASLMWLIRNGVSLVAFPQAMLIGRAVFLLVCYAFIAHLCRSEPRERLESH
jgi:O-antigen/teichoic acid export membrane protein